MDSQGRTNSTSGSSVSAPPLSGKWTLTKEAFDKLLDSLASDRDSAANKYLEIRANLLKFFEWRGCPFPEDHADETFNRVARKIVDGEEIRNHAAYIIGVARLLVLEIIKANTKQREALNEFQAVDTTYDELAEIRIECLQNCLQQLPADSRELIMEYYQGDKSAKIENRKRLGTRLGLTINTLRMRAQRLRDRLQVCVESCVSKAH